MPVTELEVATQRAAFVGKWITYSHDGDHFEVFRIDGVVADGSYVKLFVCLAGNTFGRVIDTNFDEDKFHDTEVSAQSECDRLNAEHEDEAEDDTPPAAA